MDLQAILDDTDSSEGDEDFGVQTSVGPTSGSASRRDPTTTSEYAGSYARETSSYKASYPNRATAAAADNLPPSAYANGVDLEQLLREDDDENVDDSLVQSRQPWQAYENSALLNTTATSSLPTNGSDHAPVSRAAGEDWDVLQAILGEDDDADDVMNISAISADDKDGGWSSLPPGRLYVDAILQQSDDEEVDDGLDVSAVWTPSSGQGNLTPSIGAASTTLSSLPPRPVSPVVPDTTESHDLVPTATESFATALQSEASKSDHQTVPGVPTSSTLGPTETTLSATDSSDWDLAKQSENALQYARSYENKLLKSGHRDIVSPLMVKRRLKPKIQLNSKQQQLRMKQQGAEKLNKDRLYSSIHNAPVRFGFSGVVENKQMASVSQQLLKNVPDLPTALAINSRFIAVGTQRGVVMVFDLFEVLRQRLVNGGDTPFNLKKAGSVTTVDLSLVHGEILVAGYTSGYIVLWDTIKGLALRAVIERDNPSPITSVRFLNDIRVVSVDAGGLVNMLTFSKNMLWSTYSVESECLLDGTAGQILAMTALAPYSAVHSAQAPMASPIVKKLVLIALSSERSTFAVAIEPTVHVLHRWAKPSAEQTAPPADQNDDLEDEDKQVYLPCLSWGWALVSGGGHATTPILARAWGCSLQLLRASFQEEDASMPTDMFPWPAFGVHDEFKAHAPVVALEWLSDRNLVYLTVNNEFTVIDTVMMTLVERLDFSGLPLVYAEFSLSRKAEEAQKEDSASFCTTFQNSVRTCDGRLLLVCQEELQSVSIVGAKRRISGLEQDGEWLEALALALDHYETTISSQQDRRRDPQGRKDLSKHPEYASRNSALPKSEDEEWIATMLIRYLNTAVENAPEPMQDLPPELLQSQLELAQSHFQMLAGVCVEFCVVTKRLDLLFGAIFRRFHSVGFLSVFLDVLEPYILNDKLDYIAPEAMAHFIEHCRASNGIATVERCLLHIDVTIMDFDTIVGLLKTHEMHSALFYVYNQGLGDYASPLEILCERVFDAADTSNPSTLERRKDGVPGSEFEQYGYKAILYLQYCFQGKTFPQDVKIEDDHLVATIRSQLLQFLLQEEFQRVAKNRAPEVGNRAQRYPYTSILLAVDSKALLDTLSMAMNAPDTDLSNDANFESIGRWEVEVGGSQSRSANKKSPHRQAIIGMLLSIIMPEQESVGSTRPTTQSQTTVNAFLDFLAEYLMKGVVKANKTVTFMILSRMADRFESAKEARDRLQSQKEILQLLTALPRNSYEPEEVLLLVQQAGVHRAALLLHQDGASLWSRAEGPAEKEMRADHFRAAIDCYLEDDEPDFRKEVFAYVKKECSGASDDSASGGEPNALKEALSTKLVNLVNLDSLLTAELVAELFVEDLDTVIRNLHDEKALFLFFQAIISGVLDEKDAVAGAVLNANLTMEHHHEYLALMAKLHPDDVYDYLQAHDNYRPEECLHLCQKYEIADASAYLLERMGNVSSALQLVLQTLESRMMALKRTIRGMGTAFFNKYTAPRHSAYRWKKRESTDSFDITAHEIDGVKRFLVVALDMCERNSGSFSSQTEHGSQLWFNVLDRLINAKGFLRLSKEQAGHAKVMAGVLSELLRLTMQRMVSSVPLPDLVRKVTSDHSGSRLGELREMVESLLSTYGLELNVFSGAVNVFHHDAQQMQVSHRALRVCGSNVRAVMNIPLDENSKQMQLATETSQGNGVLLLGDAGNASISDPGEGIQHQAARVGHHGFDKALAKLRSRRGQSTTPSSRPVAQRRPNQLNFMTSHERVCRSGEIPSDATYFEDRVSGSLGEAEHRGRVMSFMY